MKWEIKSSELPYSEMSMNIQEILGCIHGISNSELNAFLYPTEKGLHSPYLLSNIEEVRDRIILAINNSEKISIFSDP